MPDLHPFAEGRLCQDTVTVGGRGHTMEHVGLFKGLHFCDGGSVELMKGLRSREMETHRDRKQTRDCQVEGVELERDCLMGTGFPLRR